MITKKCRKCGKLFDVVNSTAYLCPECATISRKTGVYRERVCIDCGATFWGTPRALRCADCRRAIYLARKRDYNKHGPKRGLGSVDKCEACGKEYIVAGGLQRYCKECAPAAVLDNTRQHKRAYNANNPEIIDKARELRRGNNVCAVCGGMIPAGSGSNTCSPECAAENFKRMRRDIEARYRAKKRAENNGGN